MVDEQPKLYEQEVEDWWSNLSLEDRERAFYSVVKRIHQGEIESESSYRYILYQIFGFPPSYYILGMDCGFMALHNAIKTESEQKILDEYYTKKGLLC